MSPPSEQKLLRVGAVVAEKYRIDKAIARGGFSIVYRGTHIEMQRPVGLKILTIDDDIRASWLERFTREARLASQLTHPNTVTIYDYGQDPRGFLYLAMEWVQGVSLYQHLEQHGALGASAVARISAQILESLQEAHQLQFLHRDLKPSNIMLTRDYQGQDTVKVLDFGIAKDLREKPDSSARITHQGAFVGTPRYASPEQLKEDSKLGPPSDIYSLGLLMWEALVGDPAVPSTKYGDCVEMHLGPDPWRLPPSVFCPMGLERILYRALAKSVDARYQTCGAMRRDLLAWLDTPQARGEDNAGGIFSTPPPQSPPPLPQNTPNLERLQASTQPKHKPKAAADPLARELDRIAGDRRDNRAGHPAQAHKNAAKPAAKPAAKRPLPDRPAPLHPASPSKRPLFIGAAIASGVLVLALGWWGLTKNNDSSGPENADTPRVTTRADEPAAPPDKNLRPAPPAATYSPELIWAAAQESGWRRIGKISSFKAGAITQENGRFRRKGQTVALTVYSTAEIDEMPDYSEIAEPPVQVLDLGTTVVQVAPGTPSGSEDGVYALMSSLRKLKEIAEAQARERSQADNAP